MSAADLFAQGDVRRGVERVMHEMGPAVRGLLHTMFRKDGDAAEEAFSLFAERLFQNAGTFRGDGPLKAWVYAIARNSALTVSREGWRRLGERLATEDAEKLANEVRTRSEVRRERQSRALDALRDTLDMDEQTLLTLRLDEALPWDEVALVMSSGGDPVDAAAVRKRFERLKTRLGEEARRLGYVE